MPTIQDEQDFTTFEWEDSEDMERGKSALVSNVGDLLPLPEDLDVARYLYIAFVWVPGTQRRQGVAKKLIREFCENNPNSSVYIELCMGKRLNGLHLEGALKEIGFGVEFRLPHRIGMFLKR